MHGCVFVNHLITKIIYEFWFVTEYRERRQEDIYHNSNGWKWLLPSNKIFKFSHRQQTLTAYGTWHNLWGQQKPGQVHSMEKHGNCLSNHTTTTLYSSLLCQRWTIFHSLPEIHTFSTVTDVSYSLYGTDLSLIIILVLFQFGSINNADNRQRSHCSHSVFKYQQKLNILVYGMERGKRHSLDSITYCSNKWGYIITYKYLWNHETYNHVVRNGNPSVI